MFGEEDLVNTMEEGERRVGERAGGRGR